MTGTRWERFAAKFVDLGGCWVWTGSVMGNGYGKFWSGKRLILAHRWGYEALRRPIDPGMELDHLCRTRGCVNPAHLEVVTHAENRRRARNLTCLRGHSYNSTNTVVRPNGTRYCQPCYIARRAASRKVVA